MATAIEELLDMLYDMIEDAKNLPLSSEKCVIERDKALDLLDDIKAQLPVELAEAQKLISARTEYITNTKRESDRLLKQAEERARQLVAEDGLVAQAKQRGNEMVQQAEEKSRELRRAANEYCEDALRRTEEAVSEAYDEIRRSRAKFRAAAGLPAGSSTPQSGRAVYDAAADN